MRRRFYSKMYCPLSASLLLGIFGSGCPDEGTTDKCKDAVNPCVTEGVNRCNQDENGLQNCAKDANNCLVWTDLAECGDRQYCDTMGTTAECRCQWEPCSTGR